ncbi:MAG: chromate transporter [Proteobacteria bacterium]|nr:chromate transporter [Pseudomonadota bacterium]
MSQAAIVPQASPPQAAPRPPGVLQLLATFALISICGFGGVLAWSRRMVVDVKRWMTAEEFNDAYALCQMLPGPNIVNFSVVFGQRLRGAAGAAAALAGLMGPPFVIIALLGFLYARLGDVAEVRRVLAAMTAVAAGLVIGTCAKMAAPILRRGLTFGPLIMLATFLGIGVARWPLHWVLALMLPLSIALAWWTRR